MAVTGSDPARRFADLAEIALVVSREIHLHEYDLPEAITLTASNAQIMRYIDANPGATARDTADGTGLRRSNLSTGLRELEKIGFIERRPDESDRRGVRIFPTPKSARNREIVRGQWAEEVERFIGDVDAVVATTELLRRLATGLQAERIEDAKHGVRRQLRRSGASPEDAAAES